MRFQQTEIDQRLGQQNEEQVRRASGAEKNTDRIHAAKNGDKFCETVGILRQWCTPQKSLFRRRIAEPVLYRFPIQVKRLFGKTGRNRVFIRFFNARLRMRVRADKS